jgi:pantothenate kinase
MKLPPTLEVTEQTVDISDLTHQQTRYYQTLAKNLASKYAELGQGRQIFTLSGPAGSGKSVIAAILELIFKEEDSVFQFMNVGLDAFHLDSQKLADLGLSANKGRYDTYNTELLTEKLSAFKAGESILFPLYSRLEHSPIPDRLPTSNQNILLLIEGQWLLRNTPEWDKIRALSSHNYEVVGPLEAVRENVILRHIKGGRTPEDATNFYTTNDLPNTKEMLKTKAKADEKVLFYKDI